jgi:hypothetical protein
MQDALNMRARIHPLHPPTGRGAICEAGQCRSRNLIQLGSSSKSAQLQTKLPTASYIEA